MWTLGQRGNENSIRVMVKEFHGKIRVYISYFKTKAEDRWYPTKNGVALSLEEWDKFNEKLATIDSEVRRLRSQNEQVTPVPPTGVKRDLQSAFGGSHE